MSHFLTLRWLTVLVGILALGCSKQEVEPHRASGNTTVADAKTGKVTTPALTCGAATQVSLEVVVTAGATGAPAGFSLQWMSAAAYAANNNEWFASEDPRLCKASFSGNANLSRYNLEAGQSVTVNIGEFLFDNGASTNCGGALQCGTTYVFRAFAHANNTLQRSDFTANTSCATLNCRSVETCTFTQGYWKTHGPAPTGMNANEWPTSVQENGMMLGGRLYTQTELQLIFDKPAQGNGVVALAHQLIAAKLNVAKGADATAIHASISAADALLNGLTIPPIGSGSLTSSVTSTLVGALASYNEGATGPGHCAE